MTVPTLLVLSGRVRLDAGDTACEGGPDGLIEIPASCHVLAAIAPSVVLLTAVKDGAR